MRPTKCTPACIERAAEATRLCMTVAQTAAYMGVHRATLHRWLQLGQAGEAPCSDLYDGMESAEADAQATLLRKLLRHADDTWQSAAWVLERRYGWTRGMGERIRDEDQAAGSVSRSVLDDAARAAERLGLLDE